MEKHKRKKHKHHTKHKKVKHSPAQEKEHKHKHRHKHKKRKRRNSFRTNDEFGLAEDSPESFPSKISRLDDLAALEELERQRALIQAELDNELMEGRVHSGMGLILQGYNSSEEEEEGIPGTRCNGVEERTNAEFYMANVTESHPIPKYIERSPHDYTDLKKQSSRRRSRSRSKDDVINQHISDKGKSRTILDVDDKERPSERKQSRIVQRPRDLGPGSRSPVVSKKQDANMNLESKHESKRNSSAPSSPKSPQRTRRSRSKDRHDHKRDRDRISIRSSPKDLLAGKENRSPQHRQGQSFTLNVSSQRTRDHRSPQPPSTRSIPRNRSPARRARSRSTERRQRDSDRHQLSPARLEMGICVWLVDQDSTFMFCSVCRLL